MVYIRKGDKNNYNDYYKKILASFTSSILVFMILSSTSMSPLYIWKANADLSDCRLNIDVIFQKIHVFDDHDHFPVIEDDPGEWTFNLEVVSSFDVNGGKDHVFQIWDEKNIFDEDENGDGNGRVFISRSSK